MQTIIVERREGVRRKFEYDSVAKCALSPLE
jgi:hypothetical protein